MGDYTYICDTLKHIHITLRNLEDHPGREDLCYADGTPLEEALAFSLYLETIVMTSGKDTHLQQIVNDAFSQEQVESLEGRKLRIELNISSSSGEITDVYFNFPASTGYADIPVEVYDWSVDVNLRGQIYLAHAVMSVMREQKSGVVITVGSISGEEGSPKDIGYCSCKSAAMSGLVKSLAKYGGKYGVRCCCVAPGPVLTRPGMAAMTTLMDRAAEPQEIVDLILFLSSDKAAFITGTTVLADGGRNIMTDKTFKKLK